MAAQPSPGLPCSSPGLQCPYGEEECCCGECAPLTLTCTTSTSGASQWQASSPCTNPTCGVGCQEQSTNGADYSGTAHTTRGGLTCQAWSVQEPHGHDYSDVGDHNYCRNPIDDPRGVWCYTTDPGDRWDYCPVPLCGTGMNPLMFGILWQGALLLVPPRPPDYPAPPPGSPAPMDNRSIT